MKLLTYIILLVVALQASAQISDFKHISFKKADSIANVYSNETLKNLPELSYKLTSNLTTDAERFRAIYKWVCNNIANDYTSYLKNKRKRERFKNDSVKSKDWNNRFSKQLFKTLLKKQKTICTGYAYLVKELAQLANLECEIVQGYGRVSTTNIKTLSLPNHSWNAIKLNNKWYLCDPTWASGIPDAETNQFTFQYNDGFFLTHPKLFAVNHFPIESKWWLLNETAPAFKTFLAAPILYGKAYKHLVVHNAPQQMQHVIKKNGAIIFEYQLKTKIETNTVSFLIDNGFNTITTKPTSTIIKNNYLTLKHRFKSTGYFDVHLYIGDDLIATYTIKVNK